jgi:hypothetical protein
VSDVHTVFPFAKISSREISLRNSQFQTSGVADKER